MSPVVAGLLGYLGGVITTLIALAVGLHLHGNAEKVDRIFDQELDPRPEVNEK